MMPGTEDWALVRAYQNRGRVLAADPAHTDSHRALLNRLWQKHLITGGAAPILTGKGTERALALIRGGEK